MYRYKLERGKDLINTIVNRAQKGIQTTILSIPNLGKSRLIADVQEELKSTYSKTVVIYISVDQLPERTVNAFYKALGKEARKVAIQEGLHVGQIFENNHEDDALSIRLKLMELFAELLDGGYKIHLIVRRLSMMSAPQSFYSSLASLRDMDRSNISFLFADTVDLKRNVSIEKYGRLYEQVIGSVIWLHLPSKAYFQDEVEHWENYFDYEVPTALRNFIWQQTGGHPSLTKHIIFYFSENANTKYDLYTLLEYYTINSKLEHLVNTLSEKELNALLTIANGSYSPDIVERHIIDALTNYDLIAPEEEGYLIKIGLLQDYLLRESTGKVPIESALSIAQPKRDHKQSISIEGTRVYIEGKVAEKELTNREFRVLEFMIGRMGEVISREDLAKTIWGSKYEEKFSDWSLDQTISRLRKKLGDNGYQPKLLKTVRGRGFMLE